MMKSKLITYLLANSNHMSPTNLKIILRVLIPNEVGNHNYISRNYDFSPIKLPNYYFIIDLNNQ